MHGNCIVTIKSFTGNANNRALTSLKIGLEMLIVPAGNDIIALNPELPVGSAYSFSCLEDTLVIPANAEISVTDAMASPFSSNDKFTVDKSVRRDRIAGRVFHSGICVKIK